MEIKVYKTQNSSRQGKQTLPRKSKRNNSNEFQNLLDAEIKRIKEEKK